MKTESKPKKKRILIREELWNEIERIRDEYDLETAEEVIDIFITVFHKAREFYLEFESLLRR
jgi:hypothetical protein